MSQTVAEFSGLKAQRRRLGNRVISAIDRVLEHGQFILGPEVTELEERLTEFGGARHAVTCSSGTDALLLALMAWGVGPGDAVVVPSFTFVSPAEVVALLGATPVFADVDPRTFTLDPASLARTLDSVEGHRPVGVISVDLFGLPADYDSILNLARERDLWVLADAAQSFGASVRGKRVGCLAPATATSFFPSKPLGCYGDGGAIFTNDDELHDRMRSIRTHGQGRSKYENVRIGLNARLDTLQAAILLEKLRLFDGELAARQNVAARYIEMLGTSVQVPTVPAGSSSAWAHFTILIEDRDRVAKELMDAGIATGVYYPIPLHLQPVFATCPIDPAGLLAAEELARNVLSLPMHPYLQEDVQAHVVEALFKAISEVGP